MRRKGLLKREGPGSLRLRLNQDCSVASKRIRRGARNGFGYCLRYSVMLVVVVSIDSTSAPVGCKDAKKDYCL